MKSRGTCLWRSPQKSGTEARGVQTHGEACESDPPSVANPPVGHGRGVRNEHCFSSLPISTRSLNGLARLMVISGAGLSRIPLTLIWRRSCSAIKLRRLPKAFPRQRSCRFRGRWISVKTLAFLPKDGRGRSPERKRPNYRYRRGNDLFRPGLAAGPPSPEPLPSVAGEGFWLGYRSFLLPCYLPDKSEFIFPQKIGGGLLPPPLGFTGLSSFSGP